MLNTAALKLVPCPDRLDARRRLLAAVDRQRRGLDRLAGAGEFDRYREQAAALLTGPGTRQAMFDVAAAPAREQDRTREGGEPR
jgi:hypothetical protein